MYCTIAIIGIDSGMTDYLSLESIVIVCGRKLLQSVFSLLRRHQIIMHNKNKSYMIEMIKCHLNSLIDIDQKTLDN